MRLVGCQSTAQRSNSPTQPLLLVVAGAAGGVPHLYIFLPLTAISAAVVVKALAHHQVMTATKLAGQFGCWGFMVRLMMMRRNLGAT
jgi:hypothetical protein